MVERRQRGHRHSRAVEMGVGHGSNELASSGGGGRRWRAPELEGGSDGMVGWCDSSVGFGCPRNDARKKKRKKEEIMRHMDRGIRI